MHRTIMDILDSASLRPGDEIGRGVCNGLVMAFSLAIFSYNIEEAENTLETVKYHFSSLSNADKLAHWQMLASLPTKKNKTVLEATQAKAYLNMLALFSCILICQYPENYVFGMSPQFPPQAASINKLGEFFLFQSNKAKKTHTMRALPGFSSLYTEMDLIHFFKRIGRRIVRSNTFAGFMLSNCDHIVACIYRPSVKQWMLISDEPNILTKHKAMAFEELAKFAWEDLKLTTQPHRALHIKPIAPMQNVKLLALYLDTYQHALKNKLASYSRIQLCELFLNAHVEKDKTMLRHIAKHSNINLEDHTFHQNMTLISGLNNLFAHAIQYQWDDIKAGLSGLPAISIEDITSPSGDTFLHIMLKRKKGDVDLAKWIIHHHPGTLTAKDNKGHTPIYYAIQYKKWELAEYIAEKLPDTMSIDIPRLKDKENWSILHYAARDGLFNLAKLLIRSGADINAVTIDRWTPLHFAVSNSHDNVMEALLDDPAINLYIRNQEGKTPAGCAHESNDEVLQTLLKRNATDTQNARTRNVKRFRQ